MPKSPIRAIHYERTDRMTLFIQNLCLGFKTGYLKYTFGLSSEDSSIKALIHPLTLKDQAPIRTFSDWGGGDINQYLKIHKKEN